MTPERLKEIERLHGTEPAPTWATELLVEVRRLHGRADAPGVNLCPVCHRALGSPAELSAHVQGHTT